MRRRKTYPALVVPEILLIIFKHVTDDSGEPFLPALAAIARTCRLFQPLAEEILWDKLINISTLFNILPPRVRNKGSQSWSLNRRMFSGPDWTRFLDRVGRVRILVEDTSSPVGSWSAIFLAIAALRDPILLTPNLRKLKWQTSHALNPVINLFISPSLESLEIDAKLIINHVVRAPLAGTCDRLKHLKINGNARTAASTLSSIICGLHHLETVACATLDNDAFAHLARLPRLFHLAVDMRWSVLRLDALDLSGGFPALHTLHWKDYDLDGLGDLLLLPAAPSELHLEIEAYCIPTATRVFCQALAAKFPHTSTLSVVHDVGAGRRFGLRASAPGREHYLDAEDLAPLWTLPLRTLTLRDLGAFCVDTVVRALSGALPSLEALSLSSAEPSCVTCGGFAKLLEGCPGLRTVGTCVDMEDAAALRDTSVRNEHVTHLQVEGAVGREVDAVLRRVMPGLRTVEEYVDGMRRVREVGNRMDGVMRMTVRGGGRRTRNSLESAFE